MTSVLRRRATAGLVVVGAAFGAVVWAGPAQASDFYPTLGAANIRTAPTTTAAIITVVPQGTQLPIDCYEIGQNVNGSSLWNHVAGQGFIHDSLLLTGSNNPVVPACTPEQGPVEYDRQAAVDYARAHWDDLPTIFWLPDCTAYASRVLWAGGLPKTADWTNASTDRSKLATDLVYPGPTKAAQAADVLKNYLVRDAKLGTLQEISDEDRTIAGSAPGDLVLYDWDADGFIDHIAVIVSTGANETLVAQHTNNYIDKGWNWSASENDWLSQAEPDARSYLLHITV